MAQKRKEDRRKLLTEGSRDNLLRPFLPLFQERGIDANVSQLKQYLLNKFVSEAGINNLSLRSNLYLSGVARYYFNGDLTDNRKLNAFYPDVKDRFKRDVCNRLNQLIEVFRNEYIDTVGTKFSVPEDFGGFTIESLFKKYGKKLRQAEQPEQQSPTSGSRNGKYTYEILYNYNSATKYKQYTEPGAWCITYGKQHFDSYKRRYGIHYVVFRMDGFESVERKPGPGFTKEKPHDLYGNSLICVLQSNDSPEPLIITSRWNHGSASDGTNGTEADKAYTKQEFLNVVGGDDSLLERIYNEWSANKASANSAGRKQKNEQKRTVVRQFNYAQMLLNNGMTVQGLLDGGILSSVFPATKNVRFDTDLRVGRLKTGGESVSDNKMQWTYRASVTNDGKTFTTIMHNKKLYHEWCLLEGEVICNMTDKFTALWSLSVKGVYIFDNLHKRPFIVDGVGKFKGVSSNMEYDWDSIQEGYGFLTSGNNAKCMVDISKMDTVKAPNGDSWFEGIFKYGSYSTEPPAVNYSGDDEGLYIMTYDSSAGQYCAFSTVTRNFVPINSRDGFRLQVEPLSYTSFPLSIGDEYVMMRSVNDPRAFKYASVKNGKSLDIGGEHIFRFFKIWGDVMAKFIPYESDTYYVYDLKRRKMVTLPDGTPVHSKAEPSMFGGYQTQKEYPGENVGYILIALDDPNKYILYNSVDGQVYHDDVSGYLFTPSTSIYRFNVAPVVVRPGRTGEGYQEYGIPFAKEAAANSSVKESVKNTFALLLGKIEGATWNNV